MAALRTGLLGKKLGMTQIFTADGLVQRVTVIEAKATVLGHRLVLVPEAEGDPKARDSVIDEALQRVAYRRAVRAV